MHKYVSALTAALLMLFVYQGLSQVSPAAFDQLLTELFPDDGPGGTALVAQKGEIIYHKGFGKAHLELDVDMKVDNVFRIGSITKQFTAAAILKLAEEGKLSLEDDITQYIEDYPTHGHRITIEHLLTHTSGIRSYTGLEKWTAEERKRDFTPLEMIDYFKNEPMDFAPGEEYRYNNSAYFLLGFIIEKVTGQSYEEFIHRNFFEPLGMENSYYGNTTRIIPNRAAGYQERDGDFINADFLSMTQPYAAGSLLSTVQDIHSWYEAVMAGKVINAKSLEKANTSFRLNNGKPTGYGYGWAIGNIQGSPMIQHGGGINGFLTASLYLPEEKIFVAVFSNCNCHAPGNTAEKMAALTLGKPFDWTAIEMTENELQSYVAVYESEFDGQRIITYEDGKLFSLRTGGSRFEIFPFKKDHFFFENSTSSLQFNRNKEGKIESVTSFSTGLPIEWKRTEAEIPKLETIELPESILDSYAGRYVLSDDFSITIMREGSKMTALATGQEKVDIFPFELHKFFIDGVDAQLHFESDADGNVIKLVLVQNGRHTFSKVE